MKRALVRDHMLHGGGADPAVIQGLHSEQRAAVDFLVLIKSQVQ